MSNGRGNVASVLIGTVMVFFIGGILLGNLEGTITDMKTSDMSSDFNDTVDNLISYSWVGMGLAVLSILILAGAFVLRQTQIL